MFNNKFFASLLVCGALLLGSGINDADASPRHPAPHRPSHAVHHVGGIPKSPAIHHVHPNFHRPGSHIPGFAKPHGHGYKPHRIAPPRFHR